MGVFAFIGAVSALRAFSVWFLFVFRKTDSRTGKKMMTIFEMLVLISMSKDYGRILRELGQNGEYGVKIIGRDGEVEYTLFSKNKLLIRTIREEDFIFYGLFRRKCRLRKAVSKYNYFEINPKTDGELAEFYDSMAEIWRIADERCLSIVSCTDAKYSLTKCISLYASRETA
jgi:hypothetical protein